MSEEPVCAQKSPYQVTLEAGKAYFWCACGRSTKQPFCDGFVAETSGTVNLCGCKGTDDRPYCDGTHNVL